MNRLHPDDIKAIIDGLAPRIIQGVISGLRQQEEMEMDIDYLLTLPPAERKAAFKARADTHNRELQRQKRSRHEQG